MFYYILFHIPKKTFELITFFYLATRVFLKPKSHASKIYCCCFSCKKPLRLFMYLYFFFRSNRILLIRCHVDSIHAKEPPPQSPPIANCIFRLVWHWSTEIFCLISMPVTHILQNSAFCFCPNSVVICQLFITLSIRAFALNLIFFCDFYKFYTCQSLHWPRCKCCVVAAGNGIAMKFMILKIPTSSSLTFVVSLSHGESQRPAAKQKQKGILS